MDITVRRTVPDDADRLAEIQRDAFLPIYEKYQDSGSPCLRGKEDILPRLLLAHRFLYFTILADDKIVGGILYRRAGNGTFFKELGHDEYYLQRLYIVPEMQGNGVAKEAMMQCESIMNNATHFYVDFPVGLYKIRKCCESVGFKDTGKRFKVESDLILAFYEKTIQRNTTLEKL